MADGIIKKQKHGAAAPRMMVVLGLLSSIPCPLNAEELPDPTRPPAIIAAPVAAIGSGAVENQPMGLQSIIISRTRQAAIIGGQTIELGGKYGDAKLIEVNEGNVVLRSAQGRQVMTLFPDVKMTSRKEEVKSQSLAGKAQSGKQKIRPDKRKEEK